jgi:hypothetical protein
VLHLLVEVKTLICCQLVHGIRARVWGQGLGRGLLNYGQIGSELAGFISGSHFRGNLWQCYIFWILDFFFGNFCFV